MPDGRVMSGKFHGEGGEIILVPLGITPQAITSSPKTTSTNYKIASIIEKDNKWYGFSQYLQNRGVY